MGDSAEVWRTWRDMQKAVRRELGVSCPECVSLLPKANPTILLPGQRCRIHSYRDPRPISVLNEVRKRIYGRS